MAHRIRSAIMAGLLWAPALGIGFDAAAQNVDNVVAKLGGVELSVTDLRRMLEAQPAEVRAQITASAALMDRFVRTEIFRRALAEEARTRGFDRRPDIAEALDRAREQMLAQRYMAEQSKPAASYPTEQELAEAYRANSAEFTQPAQYRVSQIYLGMGEGDKKKDPEVVRKRIEEIAKSVNQKPAEFEAVARKFSEHKGSAEQGGDLGWLELEQMVAEVRDLLPAMKKGDLSKPVKTATGWHLVKLVDAKPKTLRPLAEVREALVRALRTQKAQENERKYLDELVARSPLGVNEIALNRLLTVAPVTASAPAADRPVPEKRQ